MSNYMALATVTATLSQLVQEAINGHPPMLPTVTHLRPDATGLPSTGVNLFLYQVTPNAAWRNVDLPARDSEGRLVTRPRVALDLHYLLTFYGDDAALEPQRLLGLTISAIHAKPVLTRSQITTAIADEANDYLASSDLAQEVELVKFTPLPLSLEELSKLWSVFFQTHYTLSIAYHATVVLLDSTMVPMKPLPVRARNLYAAPYHSIQVESVVSSEGVNEPIHYNTVLKISGRGLLGEITKVRISGVEYDPTTATDDVITFDLLTILSADRRAGIHGLQIVHKMPMGADDPPELHNSVESSVVPFVLRPHLDDDAASSDTTGGVTTVTISNVKPDLHEGQRVVLHLNQLGEDDPSSYSYRLDVAEDGDELEFTVDEGFFDSGDYLVRLQVDGAESVLKVDAGTGAYDRPALAI